MENKAIDCLLYKRSISDLECFDVHCVCEGAPERFVPKDIREIPKYKEICLKCKNHRFD